MREIKFRGWNFDDQKMFSWEEIASAKDEAIWMWLKQNKEQKWNALMQYTGLKDKNGVDVYQSDIIRVKLCSQSMIDPPSVSHETYEVTWSDEFLAWMFYDDDELLSSCDVKDMEVIGNIHENSDLIERK